MDRSGAKSRAAYKREPLVDASYRTNLQNRPSHFSSSCSKLNRSSSPPRSDVKLPHHVSVANPSQLVTCDGLSREIPSSSVPEFDDPEASKRSSQVSTVSTNASTTGRKRKTHIGPWQLGGDLGKGGCGKVRKCRHTQTGQEAAVKIIQKKTANIATAESLMSLTAKSLKPTASDVRLMPLGVEREVIIMKLLEHKNVVKLFDVWENRNELYLVMERVDGGELFDMIETAGCLEEDEAVFLLRQILAALLHCHRLGIHHRDLKPENVLLTSDTHPQVKLVDFGMAALQPRGKLLTTPCGSIHYAAPEVFEKKYDGNKIDVWSLGIILYVMLCGTTPFQYDQATMENDTYKWYDLIKRAEIPIPTSLSREASDLIVKMLDPNPKQRITLEGCWKHPLIQNYCHLWERDNPDAGSMDKWVGPPPTIGDWRLETAKDIDRDILRNLSTLWHSERESTIIARLLNHEANQEKFFYSVLHDYKQDQLENYIGAPAGFTVSASDYHHMKPPEIADLPPVPASAYQRTKSSFSIMREPPPGISARSRSKASIRDTTASEASYDPYRSSRAPLVGGKSQYNVILHRGAAGSKHSAQRTISSRSVKHPVAARDGIIGGKQHLTTGISKSSLRRSSPYRSIASSRSRKSLSTTKSKSSLASSHFASSPPVMVPSTTNKRPVNFSHLRKQSTNFKQPSSLKFATMAQDSSPVPSTAEGPISSRKEGPSLEVQQKRRSFGVDHEARKLSTELEKFCEQAFFRTSMTSASTRTSASRSYEPYDSPPSSISNRGSAQSTNAVTTPQNAQPGNSHAKGETPNTFITRELWETRRRLAERYPDNDRSRNSAYYDVLAHIDALLNGTDTKSDERRCTSGIDTGRTERLASIVEENRPSKEEAPALRSRARYHQPKSAAEDRSSPIAGKQTPPPASNTIRLVEHSPPPRIAPLNIRKVSAARNPSTSKPETVSKLEHAQVIRPETVEARDGNLIIPSPPSPVSRQDNHLRSQDYSKKRGWFSGWRKPAARSEDNFNIRRTQTPEASDRLNNLEHATATYVHHRASRTSHSSASNTSSPTFSNKRPGFFAFLKRRKPKPAGSYILGTEEDDAKSVGNVPLGSSAATHRYGNMDAKALGVQQNWFARMFHIKPISKTVCIERGIGVTRTELVRLLRGWKVHGIRDVHFDRQQNLIWGRLAPDNYLGYKEVSFVIQLFVVLKEDRRAKLSIARFTQTKGAASSFRKIVEHVETVLDGRGILVADRKTKEDMESLLIG